MSDRLYTDKQLLRYWLTNVAVLLHNTVTHLRTRLVQTTQSTTIGIDKTTTYYSTSDIILHGVHATGLQRGRYYGNTEFWRERGLLHRSSHYSTCCTFGSEDNEWNFHNWVQQLFQYPPDCDLTQSSYTPRCPTFRISGTYRQSSQFPTLDFHLLKCTRFWLSSLTELSHPFPFTKFSSATNMTFRTSLMPTHYT